MIGVALVTLALFRHAGPAVTVSYPKTIMGQFSGRIFVYVSKDLASEPRLGPDWKDPGPVFVADVKQTKGDTEIPIDDSNATGTLSHISGIQPGDYTFQAVIDRNPLSPRVGDGDGNLYSTPVRAHIDSAGTTVKLVCDQVIDEPTAHPSGTVKIVELESIPLSNAQRRSVVWRAVVVLPNEFASQLGRKFPMVVDIPDRGDSYANYPSRDSNQAAYRDGKPFIYVRIDPESATGYHTMADSANNGPYAKALVDEFLPYVAKQYHGDTNHMVVSGQGAGGWSALSLQVTRPAAFAGCWAIRPDSVDFHTLRGLNLYTATNALHTESGAAQPWTRGGRETWQTHADVEKILRGFWISGWESDFSPKGKNGKPMPLFDRVTGQIDPAVAKAWEAYDLDSCVKANWATLGPQLADKLHIFTVDGDPGFGSDAVQLLQANLTQLGAHVDAQVAHGTGGQDGPDTMLLAQIAKAEAAACYPGR